MERMAVQHAIRGIKISRGFDDSVMEISTGIYDYKMVA